MIDYIRVKNKDKYLYNIDKILLMVFNRIRITLMKKNVDFLFATKTQSYG